MKGQRNSSEMCYLWEKRLILDNEWENKSISGSQVSGKKRIMDQMESWKVLSIFSLKFFLYNYSLDIYEKLYIIWIAKCQIDYKIT